jgi:hypothetical protein
MGIRMSGRVPQLRGGTVERFATDVMGFTIGTLMRQTLTAFDPHATPEDKKLHDFFEVDIEGGEFHFVQAAEEGTLTTSRWATRQICILNSIRKR